MIKGSLSFLVLFFFIFMMPLYAQERSEKPKELSLITSLSFLTQTLSQEYQRFNILGFQRKEESTMALGLLGLERKKAHNFYYHLDFGIGLGGNRIRLSDEQDTKGENPLAKGHMATLRLESSLLGGYSFLLSHHLLTPFVGFHLVSDKAHTDKSSLDFPHNLTTHSEMVLREGLFVLGVQEEMAFNRHWKVSPLLRIEYSLFSTAKAQVGGYSRTDVKEKAKSMALKMELPFSYQRNGPSHVTMAPTYTYAKRFKTWESATQIRHLFGLSLSYHSYF